MRASSLVGADLAEDRAIHDDRRRQAAGPEAARGEHGELAIGRGFAGLDAVCRRSMAESSAGAPLM